MLAGAPGNVFRDRGFAALPSGARLWSRVGDDDLPALLSGAAVVVAKHQDPSHLIELVAARDQLTAWLAGEGPLPDWPDLDIFTPALNVTARHPSIRLAFEAAADAAAQANA